MERLVKPLPPFILVIYSATDNLIRLRFTVEDIQKMEEFQMLVACRSVNFDGGLTVDAHEFYLQPIKNR
jgi:hypothetical protein